MTPDSGILLRRLRDLNPGGGMVEQGRIDVCLASPFFYPVFGGGTMRFQGYAPGLRDRRIDMRVFTGTKEAEDIPPYGNLLPVEVLQDLPIQRCRWSAHG